MALLKKNRYNLNIIRLFFNSLSWQIDEAYAATLKFFMLPLEKKKKYLHNRSREGDPGNDGYICYKQEVYVYAKSNNHK